MNISELFKTRGLGVAIIQPTPSRDTETLKVWCPTPDDFDAFKRDYAKSKTAVGTSAGDHCKFCPGASVCPIKTGDAQAASVADPHVLDQLSENLTLALSLKEWIKSVENFAHEQMEQGAAVEGFKLVQKRATRKWSNPVEAEEAIRQTKKFKVRDFTKSTLLTPPQIEKVFKQKGVDMSVLEGYIVKQSTGTTVATVDDPRDEIAVNVNALKAALDRSQ
jgi:hypothetical protein